MKSYKTYSKIKIVLLGSKLIGLFKLVKIMIEANPEKYFKIAGVRCEKFTMCYRPRDFCVPPVKVITCNIYTTYKLINS